MQLNRAQAEKTFNRKASPDADLSTKEFISKKVVTPVKNTVRRFGRVMKSAVEWPGKQIEKEMRMDEAKDKKYKEEGEKLNRQYSGL